LVVETQTEGDVVRVTMKVPQKAPSATTGGSTR
jgi:hypothetical protein